MNKHISYRSSELLDSLLKVGKSFFTLGEAVEILSNSDPAAVRRLLSDMTRRGLILRIKDGLYAIIPYEKDPEPYLPNWHLIAEAMVRPHSYYIGFYSALDIYGLITQPSLTEQIVTEKQIVPKYRTLKKVRFEFITMGSRFWEFEKTWIDDYHKVNCSDLEKTILDCLYMPGKANGMTEIIKVAGRSLNKINPNKLFDYLEKFDSQSIYKRLGFILENLGGLSKLRKEMRKKISSSYTLLDPSLPKTGRHNSQWKVIDNIGIESAIAAITA